MGNFLSQISLGSRRTTNFDLSLRGAGTRGLLGSRGFLSSLVDRQGFSSDVSSVFDEAIRLGNSEGCGPAVAPGSDWLG